MVIQPLHGVHAHQFRSLCPLLEAWSNLMRRLAREWKKDKDCPWWYLERTAIGFFSAAVWKQGGEAIEEYGTDKKSRIQKKKKCLGRGDLMFSVKTHSRERWFVVEAKQNHPRIRGNPETLKALVKRKIRLACKEAVRCKNYGCARLGMLFLCPYVSSRPPEVTEIRNWIKELKILSKENGAAVAWSFPAVARKLSYENGKGTEYYPGVAVLIRRPRRTRP